MSETVEKIDITTGDRAEHLARALKSIRDGYVIVLPLEHGYVYACVYICMCIYIYIHTCVYLELTGKVKDCIYRCVYTCIYIYIHVNAHAQRYR